MRTATVSALLLSLGCAGGPELELALVHDDALDPTRDFTTADVLLVDLGDPGVGGDETVGLSWSGSASALLEGIALPDLDALVDGHQYVAAVAFGAQSGCVVSDRVVGRSLPFVHDVEGSRAVVSIGCTEEIHPTRRGPQHARIGHAAAALDEGVLVLGGAGALDPDMPPFWREAVTTIERYDMRTGAFTEVGALGTERVLPAALTLASGEVGAIGGGSIADSACLDSMEIVWPVARGDVATLPSPRCRPSAVAIESGDVAVHGGQLAGPTLTTLDSDLGRVVDDAALAGTPRGGPQLIPLGNAILSIGGDGFGGPVVQALAPGCGASGAPCEYEIPIAPADDPGPGWVGMTGGVVPCFEGGSVVTGTLYVTGGGVRPGPGVEPDVTLDGVFCAQLDADPTTWELTRIASLPRARREHQTRVVGNGSDEIDLLLVGGVDGASAVDEATLLEVLGCACRVVETRNVPVHGAPTLFFHTATPLPDGSVLIVGGSRINFVDMTADATPYAGLYFPDLVLP